MVFAKKMLAAVTVGMVLGSGVYAAEPGAKDVVKSMYSYLGKLKKYAFEATVSDDVLGPEGKWTKDSRFVKVEVQRPDKLRVDVKAKGKERTSYLNDGLFTMVDHGFGYYGQLKTPKTIDKALDYIFDKYGINAPLAALVYKDMENRVHFNRSKYFGEKKLDGVLCDYVAFANKNIELHMWIEKGDKPLLKSFRIIDTTVKERPSTAAAIKWDVNPKFTDKEFVFVPTKGLSKISVESAN